MLVFTPRLGNLFIFSLFFGLIVAFGLGMVKLTAELIEQAAQYTNPVRDRELDLRGENTRLSIVSSKRLNTGLCLQHSESTHTWWIYERNPSFG